MTTEFDAKKLAEQMLEATRQAIFAGDHDAFCALFVYPCSVESFDGEVAFETPEVLRVAFDMICDEYAQRGITDLSRDVIAAEFNGQDELQYSYTTRLIAGTILIERTYPNLTVLHRVDGAWKIKRSQHAIAGTPEIKAKLIKMDGAAPPKADPPTRSEED